MDSGQWHVEKRFTLRNESFLKEYGPALCDLAKKKTFPALFNLYHQGFLNPDVHIFGYARTKISDQELRDKISGYLVDEKNASEKAEALSKLRNLDCTSERFESIIFKLEVLDHKTRERTGVITPTLGSPVPVLLQLDGAIEALQSLSINYGVFQSIFNYWKDTVWHSLIVTSFLDTDIVLLYPIKLS